MGSDASAGRKPRWSLRRALFCSALLHLLAPVLLARCDPVTGWLGAEEIEAPPRKEPFVFEFVEPPNGPEPEEAPETNLVSTRKSAARSDATESDESNELPLASGDSPLKEAKSEAMSEPSAPPAGEPARENTTGPGSPPENRSLLSPSAIRRAIDRSIEERRFENRSGKKTIPGDLSFNTVDFEFAPYLLELKRRIEEKWYPPVAFRGGLPYRGASIVRFAVEKNGALGLLELIEKADHPSLDTAAMSAVRFGAPFPPLPEDFPEERWVITCTFYYR